MSKHSTPKSSARVRLQRMTISAVFVALSCVAKFFQITIPVLGAAGMHISAAGIFSTLPALLFGPLYGGVVAGLVDLIGFFMTGGKDGPFVFELFLTAILCGVLKGLFWNLFIRKEERALQKHLMIAFGGVFSALLLFGVWNFVCIQFLPNFAWTNVLELLKGKTNYTTYGLIILGVGGLLCVGLAKIVEVWIRKKWGSPHIFQLLMTLLLANVPVTTINTVILMHLYEISAPFLVFYIPRLIEELIMVVIQAFILSWLVFPVKKVGRGILPEGRI